MDYEKNWLYKFNLAKNYYEEHGNLLVPRTYEISDTKLGVWINNQRFAYKNNKLDIEKVKKLESIDMKWIVKNNLAWKKNYKLAKDYCEENGHLLVPYNYEINDIKLGQWINTQRTDYKNKTLKKEKLTKLSAIDMVWKTNEIKQMDKIVKFLKVADKNSAIEVINENIYLIDLFAINNFINLTFGNYYTNVDYIHSVLRNNLNEIFYNALILYFLGLDINRIGYLYNIKVKDIEKGRLLGMKLILENLNEKDYLQDKMIK